MVIEQQSASLLPMASICPSSALLCSLKESNKAYLRLELESACRYMLSCLLLLSPPSSRSFSLLLYSSRLLSLSRVRNGTEAFVESWLDTMLACRKLKISIKAYRLFCCIQFKYDRSKVFRWWYRFDCWLSSSRYLESCWLEVSFRSSSLLKRAWF